MKKLDAAQGIIDPDGHCYRRQMHGAHPNEDIKVHWDA
jgi:hypothetical protein